MDILISLRDTLFNGQFLESIFFTILAIVFFWLVHRLALAVFLRNRDVQVQYRIRKTVTYITYPFTFVVIGQIWFTGFQSKGVQAGPPE